MTDFEDEPPCMHHRSQFDTLPAPAMLQFPGGAAEIRKPTREELVLSVQQWTTAIRESFIDNWCADAGRIRELTLSRLDRLDAVLAKLAAL